jgi:hypothetical protein
MVGHARGQVLHGSVFPALSGIESICEDKYVSRDRGRFVHTASAVAADWRRALAHTGIYSHAIPFFLF